MSAKDDLYAAVVAQPDDEAPRLAYADWCDSHGDPQGEFIRLQLAASEARRSGTDVRHAELTQAAIELRKQHSQHWTRDVQELASQPQFSRGFVEGVTIDAAQFLDVAARLYALAPIRHVTLTGAGRVVADLAASPHLARLVSITFYDKTRDAPLRDEGLITLLSSPYLGKLRQLLVPFNQIGNAGLEAFCAAQARVMPNLVYFGFGNNLVDSPAETYGEDWMTGHIVRESIALPERGRLLEAKYGYQAWMHAASLLRHHPPLESDF